VTPVHIIGVLLDLGARQRGVGMTPRRSKSQGLADESGLWATRSKTEHSAPIVSLSLDARDPASRRV
jgi:hypothetical protein